MEARVHNEVLGGDSNLDVAYLSTGVYDQARFITWVILNRMALTLYLDQGRRHGNNATVIYCHVSVPDAPCSSTYVSPNQHVRDGIDSALNAFYFQPNSSIANADPTDGSMEWRHIPNDGWANYAIDQVVRQPDITLGSLEAPEVFWDRHHAAASDYMATVDTGGRNYTSPQVTRDDLMRDGYGSPRYLYFASVLSRLGTLTVFARNTNTIGTNYYEIVIRIPPAGGTSTSSNSCPA